MELSCFDVRVHATTIWQLGTCAVDLGRAELHLLLEAIFPVNAAGRRVKPGIVRSQILTMYLLQQVNKTSFPELVFSWLLSLTLSVFGSGSFRSNRKYELLPYVLFSFPFDIVLPQKPCLNQSRFDFRFLNQATFSNSLIGEYKIFPCVCLTSMTYLNGTC